MDVHSSQALKNQGCQLHGSKDKERISHDYDLLFLIIQNLPIG